MLLGGEVLSLGERCQLEMGAFPSAGIRVILKRTSECSFRKWGRPKVEFGSSRISRKSLYSHRTADLAILDIMPIRAFSKSIS